MQSNIFSRLDLDEYLLKFNGFLARQKPLFLAGDSKLNYEKICELCKIDFKLSKQVANLDDALSRITKQGVLHISEIYEFVKIFNYFEYLKGLKFEKSLGAWLDKIIQPTSILALLNDFDNEGKLKDSVDERLVNLSEAFRVKKEQIETELKKLIYSKNLTPYLVDTQIHYINENETILVRGGFNHALKGNVVGRSSSGYFYILPSSVAKIKSEQNEILDKKEEIVFEYCKKVSQIFNKNYLFLKFINTSFDTIDSLCARAMMAKSGDLEFVLTDGSRDINLSEFCHPALKNPKPIDVNLNKKVILVTGVNAGGKSMLLKSALSAALLARYLLPMKINANRSKIGTFKECELIMEDPQNVKNDISTFAGRMVAFNKIFGKKNLLLGVDEIELGTDFEEAASLFSVIISKLIQTDIKLIITTHHKRLAMLLSKSDDVELIAALYDENLGRPKYEFLKGIIGKSYAFETALRYGISPNIVIEAKRNYGEDKENLNEAISKAINLESELKIKLDEASKKSEKLDTLLEGLKNQKEKHEEILRSALSRLELEFYRAISEAKRSVNLKDLKEKQRVINAANELLKQVNKPKFEAKIEFKVGDRVKYDKIKGEIVSLNKTDATILADGLKLRVPISLLKLSGNQPKMQSSGVNIKVQKPNSASLVLDLHGLRSDEAISKLDKFISDSLILGFDEVIVKHGIGTGKLAFAVKEFLKSHPSVKSFSDGLPNQGGFGSKVVKF